MRYVLLYIMIQVTVFSAPRVDPRLEELIHLKKSDPIQVLLQFVSPMDSKESQKSPVFGSKGTPSKIPGRKTGSKGAPFGKIPGKGSKGTKLSRGLPPDVNLQEKMQQMTSYAQKDFLAFLAESRKSGILAKKLNSFWINNSILLEAPGEFFASLFQRNDILYMTLNRKVTLPQSPDRSPKALKDEHIPYGLKALNIPGVIQDFNLTGAGVKVGILDTGYVPHSFLGNRVIQEKDFTGNPNGALDGHGHGTHSLGLIGGAGKDWRSMDGQKGILLTGSAPEASFLVGKVFDDQGKSNLVTLLQGLQWLADPDGDPYTKDAPKIISASWGDPVGNLAEEKPLWDAVIKLRQLGISCFFAAGNEGPDTRSINAPAAFPHSIGIGAIGQNAMLARYSSRGPIEWEDVEYFKPDYLAPGSHILSLGLKQDFRRMTGTSMATPLAAGVGALVYQANPGLSPDELKKILQESAVDYGDPGRDHQSGYGLIDAFQASLLALKGGQVKGYLDGLDGSGRIFVYKRSDTNLIKPIREIRTRSTGAFDFWLAEGQYNLVLSGWGASPSQELIEVYPGQVTRVTKELQPSFPGVLKLTVKNEQGEIIPSRIEFLDSGFKPEESSTTRPFEKELPQDVYLLKISSQGYLNHVVSIVLDQDFLEEEFLLKIPPPLGLIDLDHTHHYGSFLEKSLLGLEQKYHQEKNLIHALNSMNSYQTLILGSGSLGHGVFTPEHIQKLRHFVQTGGSLILHGQDLVFSLQEIEFAHEVLGVDLVDDDSNAKQVIGAGFQLALNGEHSAANQLFPDAIAPVNSAQQVLSYSNGKGAGVLHRFGSGKVITLGFGLEGIEDEPRQIMLAALIKLSEPDPQQTSDLLGYHYLRNQETYQQLLKSMRTYNPERLSSLSETKAKEGSAALRPTRFDKLHQLQKRKAIFDELYEVPMTY